jgi:hypothetical protein
LSSKGIDEKFPEKIAKIGALNEELHAKDVGDPAQRELPLNSDSLYGLPCGFHGRADFVIDSDSGRTVQELKSATSKNTYSKVFKKCEYKPENLAQLLAYMVMSKADRGELIYSFYEEEQRVEQKVFNVLVMPDGKISVENAPISAHIFDLFTHQRQSATFLLADVVGSRPEGYNKQYGGPCSFCVFKPACQEFDSGKHTCTYDFCERCKELISIKEAL